MSKHPENEVAQSCSTLCDPVDCSLPGSSVHGIVQARILERVAISSSRGSSQARDQTPVSCIASGLLTIWATGENPNAQKLTAKHFVLCWENKGSQKTTRFSVVMKKTMATHSSVLAWRIPGIAEPGGLLSMGSDVYQHRTRLKRLGSSILYWCFFFWLTLLCIIGSSFIHLIRTDSNWSLNPCMIHNP